MARENAALGMIGEKLLAGVAVAGTGTVKFGSVATAVSLDAVHRP